MDNNSGNIRHNSNSEKILNILESIPAGIIIFNSNWKIDFVNENFFRFGEFYNLEIESLPGQDIRQLQIFPDQKLIDEFNELLEGIPFEKELKNISTSDQSKISLLLKGTPIVSDEEFLGGILMIEDLRIPRDLKIDDDLYSEQIEKIINKVNDFLFVTDKQGNIKYAFGKKLKILQREFKNIIDLNVELIFNNYKKEFQKSISLVQTKKLSDSFIIEQIIEGENFIYQCKVEPLINKKGQIQFIFFLLNDITEITKDKEKLENENKELQRYQQITESASDAIFAVDLKGDIKFWNRACEKLFNHKRVEVYNKFFGRVLGLFDEETFGTIKQEVLKDKYWKRDITVFKDDDKKEFIEAKFTFAEENPDLIVVHCTDVTEKTALLKGINANEEKYKSIAEKAEELICTLDLSGKITYVNNAFSSTLKYSKNDLIGENIKDFIHPQFLRENELSFQEFETNENNKIELPIITGNNEKLIFSSNFCPVYFESIGATRFNVFSFNITKNRETEKDLTLYKNLFEASQDGIAVEKEGRIVIANNSFAETFGFRPDEIIDSEIFDLVSERDILKITENFQVIKEKKENFRRFEFLGKRKDGTNFYSEASVAAFEAIGKNYDVIVVRDITEKKRTQQAIRESEEKFRNITENIDDFLYTYERLNHAVMPTFFSASIEKITGYNKVEFLEDSRLILKIIHPDDFNLIKRKLKNIFKSRITLSDEFEFRLINRHGNIVWIRNKINITRDKNGQLQRIYGLVSDISLRKKAEEELEKSKEDLIKLNETKDRFLSIISHDLRTPFSSILGFTDILLSEDDLGLEERKQYVKYVRESSLSMLNLVNSLLDWTRLQTGRIKFEPEKISAFAAVHDSVNALSGAAFQKNIKLLNKVERGVSIFVDESLINQVFNNLISNAIKFTPEGGSIIISARPSERLRFYEFSVKDTGVGIRPDDLDKLFKVDSKFTSTGTAGEKGSGLGLSLVKEIVERHGGTIEVESEFEKGTEFKFLLPTASSNILLVDDSKTDRLLYSKILKNITPDYVVDIASNGKEALDKILESPPALVITDHLMPEMNGYELVREVLHSNIKGKPPIIVLSSEIDRNDIKEYNELGIQYVFYKPVNLGNFKQAVEKSLRQGISEK